MLLASCTTPARSQVYPLPTPSAVIVYLAPTAQNAQINAQATMLAVQAQAQELSLTSTALALDFVRAQQTDDRAGDLTATAVYQVQAAATAEAQLTQNHLATQTAEANAQATATRSAAETQAALQVATQQAQMTATAWPPHATATQAYLNQVQTEATGRTIAGMFWAAFWPALALLTLLGLVRAYAKLLPAFNLWLRTRRGPNGETTIALGDGEQDVDIIMPGRLSGPALRVRREGIRVEGYAPDLGIQERVTGRAQAVELARAYPEGRRNNPSRLMREVAPATPPSPHRARYEILPTSQSLPPLEGAALSALDADWSGSV